jgi:hypothetical protein
MPEADFQQPVAWLQVEKVESDPVRRSGLVRHDATDDLAQETRRSPALTSDELRAAHFTVVQAGTTRWSDAPRRRRASRLGTRPPS